MSLNERFPIDNWNFNSESVLQHLPAEALALLTAHQSVHTHTSGEVIFREGAFAAGIFFIREGIVKKYKVDAHGREQIIYIANSGELLGYHAVLANGRYTDSAAALENSTVVFIPKEDFLAAVQQSPVLSWRLLKTLSHEFTVLSNSVSLFGQKTVRERLALQLIVLREKYKVNFQAGMPVAINISRDDLASLVGTARENIVRVLKEFKEKNILKTEGRKIIILEIDPLLLIADYKPSAFY